LVGLKFIATDGSDLFEVSRSVNVLVKQVSFEVVRENSGVVSDSNPAIFSGQGLPDSLVKARFDSNSGQMINSTRVSGDGTWSMQISASQLGSKDNREIVFEMDGQIFADDTGNDAQFSLSTKSAEDSSNLLLYGIIGIVIIIALVAVGMFFFTFEEYDDEDELTGLNQVSEDPYAWAKSKAVPVIESQQSSIPQQNPAQPAQQQVAVAQQTSQHPGWLWDAEQNQWVPDPDYVNNNQ
jgi:hypothetical protein